MLALENISSSVGVDKTLDKLKSLFQKNNVSWIEVDYSRWGCADYDNDKFAMTRDCILNSTILEFDYINSYGDETKRKVQPIKLVFKARAWYFQGYCLDKDDFRVFKLNRMNNIIKTEEPFSTQHDNIPPVDIINTMDNTCAEDKVVLKFSKQIKHRIYDELYPREIEKNPDGSYNVTLNLPNDAWTVSYIMSFGEHAEVVSPEYLRDRVKDEIKKVLALYNC